MKSLRNGLLQTVVPLFKKGDMSLVCNYRPVSLTCVPCKLLEQKVWSNILWLICMNINSCQTNNMHSGIGTVGEKFLDKQGQVDTFILDFEKALDTPPHEVLKCKLFSYGIGSKTMKWIYYFQQRVAVNGIKTNGSLVVSGVPQGTDLGSLLISSHIIYITSDIESEIRPFADKLCLLP